MQPERSDMALGRSGGDPLTPHLHPNPPALLFPDPAHASNAKNPLSERILLMSNYNQIILMGYMTRDPVLSYTPNQTAVVVFGLGVNRTFKKADGTAGEEKLFIECQCFGKRAEVISKHFSKGQAIFLDGHLKLETWEKDGQPRSRIRVIVSNFEFVGKKAEEKPY